MGSSVLPGPGLIFDVTVSFILLFVGEMVEIKSDLKLSALILNSRLWWI